MWFLLMASAWALETPMSAHELFERADRVVDVEITGIDTRWSADFAGIETEVDATVLAALKGTAEDVYLVQPGGRIDAHHTWVEDVPELFAGGRYLLFIIDTPAGTRVLGGERGAVRLDAMRAWEVSSRDWTEHTAPVEEPFELNVGTFSVLAPAADVEEAFLDALHVWNSEARSDFVLRYGGTSTVTQHGGGNNDHNTVHYGGNNWTGTGMAVAVTNGVGSALTDCDIRFWASNIDGGIDWHFGLGTAPSGRMDFRHTAVHEMGHCLGMSHSADKDAIMYGRNRAGTGDERRHLTPDDIGGIQYLYGAVSPNLGLTRARRVDGELVLTVANIGDGSAWDVIAELDDDVVEVGEIGSDTPVGRVVGDAEVDLVFPGGDDCKAYTGLLRLEDGLGTTWELDVDIDGDCPGGDKGDKEADDAEEPVGGCACSAGPSMPASLLGVFARR